MNFQPSKENIQPLATGRIVEQLETGLNAETNIESQQEILAQRKQFEHEIASYVGVDPLELWLEYINWTEQSYPKSGKASALDELLKSCLSKFEGDVRYTQDQRLIRVFIKFIDTKKSPLKFYERMYNSGMGTMVAEFYIAWAFYYDLNDNFDEARKVYQKGLDARAEPVDQLKQVFERFQFSVGQRVVRKDEFRAEFLRSMEEQRNAFTSLRSFKKTNKVGSVRTGSAVKSSVPGHVTQSHASSSVLNVQFKVFEGESQTDNRNEAQHSSSIVGDIERSERENRIEPGPWSKAAFGKSVFRNIKCRKSELGYNIYEDDDDKDEQGKPKTYMLPFTSKPQTPFIVAAYVYEDIVPNDLPHYESFYLHPNKEVCFSSEELRHYSRCKARGIENDFTKSQDKIWAEGTTVPLRKNSRFTAKNQPSSDMVTTRYDISAVGSNGVFKCKISAVYVQDSNVISFEEMTSRNRSENGDYEMDETICIRGRQSFGVKFSRRSVAGGRKSIMPSLTVLPKNVVSVEANKSSDMEVYESIDMEIDEGNKDKPQHAVTPEQEENASAMPSNQSKRSDLTSRESESKNCSAPKPEWSIFKDEEGNASPVTRPDEETNSLKKEQPVAASWSIFTDYVISPTISSTDKAASSDQDKEIFAVPQIPLTAMKRAEIFAAPAPDLKRTLEEYSLGPQTGAVKKAMRKSIITENAVMADNGDGAKSIGTFKRQDVLDYSLCTQNFNFNLAEEMVSTPVPSRRTEALTDVKKPETQVQQPLKLSTIMETSEGSAHTASTKSSTQFSSPEEDESSKRTNVTNRTKFVSAVVSPDGDTSENKSNSKEDEVLPIFQNYSFDNIEKTLPTIQMSFPLETSLRNKEQATELVTKDVRKNCPFVIFEDNQESMANLNETDVKPNREELSPTLVADLSEPQCEHSIKELTIPTVSNDLQLPSFWIKDEPHSSTDKTLCAETFAMPNERSAVSTQNLEFTKNNAELDGSANDESFALPSFYQNLPSTEADTSESSIVEVDDSDSELEVIVIGDETLVENENILKIVQVESLAQPEENGHHADSRFSISVSEDEAAEFGRCSEKGDEVDEVDHENSIYFKHNSILVEPIWIEGSPDVQVSEGVYEYQEVNLDESRMIIQMKVAQPAFDPFDEILRNATLQNCTFIDTLEKEETVMMVKNVPAVTVKRKLTFKETHFDVLKVLGHGAYGRVYKVKLAKDGMIYAAKKELPANLWEIRILMEVQDRIPMDFVSAFMKINFAIVGNEASIIFSEFSPYGTLLDVMNKVFSSSKHHVDEAIVFVLAYQMLQIVHCLHKADILHLDLKPDNFLVMTKMSMKPRDFFIQLIDFGNSVDLRQFPAGQKFNGVLETKHFVCTEMLEKKPWIFEPDLYCLAGTIHSVLLGSYMNVKKVGSGYGIVTRIPRYFNGAVWDRFFNELINVKGESPPDLGELKKLFIDAIDCDNNLAEKIKAFNNFIVAER